MISRDGGITWTDSPPATRYYNPETGAFGHRSVWYGPYGGYSYGEGYNPRTGRYGFRETAWDGDEWASYSEVYNDRRGTKTTTSLRGCV